MRTSFSRSRRRVRTTEHAESRPSAPWPIVLSARSEEALRGCAAKLAAWLDGALESPTAIRRCCPTSSTRSARGAIITRTGSRWSRARCRS